MSHSLMEGHDVVCWWTARCVEGSVVIQCPMMTHTTHAHPTAHMHMWECTSAHNCTHVCAMELRGFGIIHRLRWITELISLLLIISSEFWSARLPEIVWLSPKYIENYFQYCSLWGWYYADFSQIMRTSWNSFCLRMLSDKSNKAFWLDTWNCKEQSHIKVKKSIDKVAAYASAKSLYDYQIKRRLSEEYQMVWYLFWGGWLVALLCLAAKCSHSFSPNLCNSEQFSKTWLQNTILCKIIVQLFQ